MCSNYSGSHYFYHGDITLLAGNVLYKLHLDMLETHSEYFRNGLHITENDNGQATSDESPLVLSPNECSAEAFDIICNFLYPKKIGRLPAVLVKETEKWESVLQAAVYLQMRGLREHILANFEGDIVSDPPSAARLLGLAARYDEAPNSLKLRCLYALVFLRRAISPSEMNSLGGVATFQVIAIRDRIRILIATSPTYWATIHRHYLCAEGPNCQNYIHEGVFNNVKKVDPLQDYYQADSSIFDIPEDNRICFHCYPIRSELASTMAKQELKGEIRRHALGLGLLRIEES